jgi:hypothetical protein
MGIWAEPFPLRIIHKKRDAAYTPPRSEPSLMISNRVLIESFTPNTFASLLIN